MKKSNQKVVVAAAAKKAPVKALTPAQKASITRARNKLAAQELADAESNRYTTTPELLEKYGVTAAKYYRIIDGAKFADTIRKNTRPSYRYGRILRAVEDGAISDIALAEYFAQSGVAPLSTTGKNKEVDGGAKSRLNYLKGYLADLVNTAYKAGGTAQNRRVFAVVDQEGHDIG